MILMFGDTHGDFRHVLPAVEAEKPKAIIFLGDLQAQRPLEQELASVLDKTEVWWIPGNHDTDSRKDYDNLFTSQLADRNLHGRVVEIDGYRVAGLGGIFRSASWYPRLQIGDKPSYLDYDSLINAEMEAERWKEYRRQSRETMDSNAWKLHKQKLASGWKPDLPPSPLIGKALTHRSTIFFKEWMALGCQDADILVTHEAPTSHPHGFAAIDVLAQSMKVKALFHGHHHDRLNYAAHEERLSFSVHGVGLRGITDMYGRMIRAGQLDEERSYRQDRI
jgi:predicted phosphodiesterase